MGENLLIIWKYQHNLGDFCYFIDRSRAGILHRASYARILDEDIPDRLDGAPVTEICDEAFEFAWFQKTDGRVCLPDSVLYIGESAFKNVNILCKAGKKACIVLPAQVNNIGKDAFKNIVYQWSEDGHFAKEPLKKGDAGLEICPGQDGLKGFPWGATFAYTKKDGC